MKSRSKNAEKMLGVRTGFFTNSVIGCQIPRFYWILFPQVIVEVRDSLRGLGTGVKRSLDDTEGKSHIRAKTRERYDQAVNAISGPQRFVPANVGALAKLSPNAVAESKKPTEQEVSPKEGTEKSHNDEAMDIFAE